MPTGDTANAIDKALGVDETDTYSLGQPGADSLSGTYERATTASEVVVVWQDKEKNDIIEEQLVSPSAGTKAPFDVPARGAKARLEVRDTGSGSGAYSLTAHMR